MIEDIKDFYKLYKLYKKGKTQMDKIKEFVDGHTKEIISGLVIIASYQIGFKRGFKKGIKFEDALISIANGGK